MQTNLTRLNSRRLRSAARILGVSQTALLNEIVGNQLSQMLDPSDMGLGGYAQMFRYPAMATAVAVATRLNKRNARAGLLSEPLTVLPDESHFVISERPRRLALMDGSGL